MLPGNFEHWTVDRVSAAIARGSLWMEILGGSLVVLGILALGPVVITSFASVFLIGALLLAAGALQIAHSFLYWRHRWGGFFLGVTLGGLYAMAGLISLVNPQAALYVLTYTLGVVFIAMGVLRGGGSLSTRFPGWGWGVATGAIEVLLGILILSSWPADSLVVLGTLVALQLIVAGLNAFATGFAVRKLLGPPPKPVRHRPITRFQG